MLDTAETNHQRRWIAIGIVVAVLAAIGGYVG